MDIVTKKLNFVQEFLRISDEELVDKLEKFLRNERRKKMDKEIKPLTMNEFNQMIENAEVDIKNDRVVEARKLLKKVEKWK